LGISIEIIGSIKDVTNGTQGESSSRHGRHGPEARQWRHCTEKPMSRKLYNKDYMEDLLDSWIFFNKKKSKESGIFAKKGFIEYENFI